MASRYGGMKQMEAFGPDHETIMDYSIYDAIRAGFGKIVFIIREEFSEQFKQIFEPKLKGRIETVYVYQNLDAYLKGYHKPLNRTKPWGTAHAVLCAKHLIDEPFAVINADDFYGRDSFEKSVAFLNNDCNDHHFAIVGYHLKQTLSDHGTVNRGVCKVDAAGHLQSIVERLNISYKEGIVTCDDGLFPETLSIDTVVSMNFWCFHPSIFQYTENLFDKFLSEKGQDLKSEFYIPNVADQFIQTQSGKIEIIPTTALWFGVTYKEDAPVVKNAIHSLLEQGSYPTGLWRD